MTEKLERALFSDRASRDVIEARLSVLLGDALSKVSDSCVSPTLDILKFRHTLESMTFDETNDLLELLDWTIDSMKDGLVQLTNPRYFGLFNPAPAFPAECADRIVAAFNPQICVWSHAPVAVEIESHVIKQVGLRAGFSAECGGHFTSGGSEANNTAVLCALTASNRRFADIGSCAFDGQPRIYASQESHLAWLKIGHQTGIGRNAICLVRTDGHGRMDADALQQAIERDAAEGMAPVMIAATAGTTNAGMVDPLGRCSDIAEQYRLWLHIDAAWGGALIASDRHNSVLNGIDRADSITIDAHKWFAATMGTGMFLTQRTAMLQEAFTVSTDYMPSDDASVDLYLNSMQWSRRFVGLRLFLSLATVGWRGYARHVENSINLIDRLTTQLSARSWSVANNSQMAVACVVPPSGHESVDKIVKDVVDGNDFWISATRFEGMPVIRVCVTNGKTTIQDIDCLVEQLVELAK